MIICPEHSGCGGEIVNTAVDTGFVVLRGEDQGFLAAQTERYKTALAIHDKMDGGGFFDRDPIAVGKI